MDTEKLLSWLHERGTQLTVFRDERITTLQLDFWPPVRARQQIYISEKKFRRDSLSKVSVPTLTDALKRLMEAVEREERADKKRS